MPRYKTVIKKTKPVNLKFIQAIELRLDLDILPDVISIPLIYSLIKEAATADLLNYPSKSKENYQKAYQLLQTLPVDKLYRNNEKVVNSFIEGNFLEGLKYLAINDPPKFKTHLVKSSFFKSMRHPSKKTFLWIIEYIENHKINIPFLNDLQKAIIKKDLRELNSLLEKYAENSKQLPKHLFVTDESYSISDIFEDACLMGDLNIVKKIYEYANKKFVPQFNMLVAFEASLFCRHDEITFYLLDKLIEEHNWQQLIILSEHLLQSERYIKPGPSTEVSWNFNKEFVEKCINYFLKSEKLTEEEKSALLIIPVLYLMTAFPYFSRHEFFNIFNDALELFEKNLPLPPDFTTIKKIISVTDDDPITDDGKINILKQIITKTITDLLNLEIDKSDHQFRFLLNNLSYYENFYPEKLLVEMFIATFAKRASETNKPSLYFYLTKKQDEVENFIEVQPVDDPQSILIHSKTLKDNLEYFFMDKDKPSYLKKLSSLIIKTIFILHGKDPDDDIVKKFLYNLVSLIKIGFKHHIFDETETDLVVPLLCNFIILNQQFSYMKNIPIDNILAILLRYNAREQVIATMQDVLDNNLLLPCFNPFLTLLHVYVHIMQTLDLPFDPNYSWYWYQSEGCGLQQLFRISTYPFLKPEQGIKWTEKNIKKLNEALKSISDKELSKNFSYKNITCYLLPMSEFTVASEILFKWTEKFICENTISNVNQYRLLELKENLLTIILSLHSSSKDMEIVGNENSIINKTSDEKKQIHILIEKQKKIENDLHRAIKNVEKIKNSILINKNRTPTKDNKNIKHEANKKDKIQSNMKFFKEQPKNLKAKPTSNPLLIESKPSAKPN